MNNQVGFSLTPQNVSEAMELANLMAQSEMVPKDFQGKPANVLIAVQMGGELGFKPVQALQNIAVVNGRPCVWGDGLRALVMSAPDLSGMEDLFDKNTMTARCVIKRVINGNEISFTGEFSQQDAQDAGLWGRNTWAKYPKKMLEWRAFGFAARKAYADRLRGLQLAEEVQDYEPVEKQVNEASSNNDNSFYPDSEFEKQLPAWSQIVKSGKKTHEQLIDFLANKGVFLNDSQIETIKQIEVE